MHVLLSLFGSVLIFAAALVFLGAKSAVHEILSAILGLSALCAFAGAGLISAVNRLRESVERADRNAWNMGRHLSKVLQHPEADHGEPGELPKN